MPHQVRGDEAELFRRYGDWLVRLTRLRLQFSEALAEDAAAFAWLQLCRVQPERTESLPGWLLIVALHEGYRLLRQAGREPLAEDVCRQGPGGRRRRRASPRRGARRGSRRRAVGGRAAGGAALPGRSALASPTGARAQGGGLPLPGDYGGPRRDLHERNRHVTEGRAELRQLGHAA